MNRILTTLALVSTVAAADASASNESKIQEALDNFAAHSDEILQRAMKEGSGGAAAIDTVGIDANGDIISSSSAALYADFGLKAVNTELDKIYEKLIGEHEMYEEYYEAFEELAAENGEDSTTITYDDLEEWEDIGPVVDKLGEGEFFDLWHKATGSDDEEGEMNLYQFFKFNDLLDNLVMAKVDFKALSKRMSKPEIPYNRLHKWSALSDDLSDDNFQELWKKALGADDAAKDVMNYEQFLVFWDLAEEWLQRDIIDVVEEEKERRENYWVKSGNNKDAKVEEVDDDGYNLRKIALEDRPRFFIADWDLPEDIKAGLASDDEDIRNEAALRRRLDPEMWEQFSYWDIYAYFGCEMAFDSPRPLWTEQQWRDVRDFYHEFIEEDKKIGPPGKIRSYQSSKDEVDFSKTFIPFQSGEKGRGLQAVRDIKAGEVVFKATNNTIIFNYGHTWRKLLFAINEHFDDPGMTCDVHAWSWVQDLYEGGPIQVFMDLDSGSLLNEGRDEAGWDPPNVQCGKPDATRCDSDYYAFRDIKKGDELLIDYREFAFLGSWPSIGL